MAIGAVTQNTPSKCGRFVRRSLDGGARWLNAARLHADTPAMPLRRPSASEKLRSSDRGSSAWPSLGYEIEAALGVVRVELFDRLDVPQLAHALDIILRDPVFQPGFHVCLDCRQMRRAPSRKKLFAMGTEVRTVGLTWQAGRIAVVVRRPQSRFAARCIPMVLPAGMIARTRVVISVREALRWFDVTPTPTWGG